MPSTLLEIHKTGVPEFPHNGTNFSWYFGGGANGDRWRVETWFLSLCVVYLIGVYFKILRKGNGGITVKTGKLNERKPKLFVTRVYNGPIRLPYLDGAITLYKLNKHGVKMTEELASKWGQGGVFSIEAGPELIYAITDASIAHKILNSADPSHLNKPQKLYDKIFVAWLKEGLVNSKYEKWSRHRKILNRAFTYKSLQTYLKFIMNQHAKNLATDLLTQSKVEGKIEGKKMYDLIYFHTIKIISQILLGNQCCTDEESAAFHENFHEYKHCALYRFLHPELFFEPLWLIHPKKKVFDRLIKWCNEFGLTIINRYKAMGNWENKDDHDSQAECEDEDNMSWEYESASKSTNGDDDDGIKPLRCTLEEMLYAGLPDKEILDEIGTFMSAGHETTSMALQMLMFNLALNPKQQSRCHEEVDALFNSKLVSSDFDYDLNVDDLVDLKYLERCILESGRITPTVPLFARKLDVPLKVDENLEFPGDATVVLLPWVIHRDPRHYEAPEMFDPDRFLPENAKRRHPGAYLPFSGGPRNCIGWKVATMEMKVIMAWLLRYFEIHTTDKRNDVKLFFDVTLEPERPHNIILKRRKNFL